MTEITINIFEQIGSTAAVSSEDGEILFNRIVKAFENTANVIIDFNSIKLITPTFFNTAIGQLYSKYDSSFLKSHLKVNNMAIEDKELLIKVVERAKEYFKNKEMGKSIKEVK
ncbi:STAS-like domain-containing protein [Candidatus Poribacteria bacterium]|nr:STAS-like domain-containing protein [Candidatus Poribacteria bacterium]